MLISIKGTKIFFKLHYFPWSFINVLVFIFILIFLYLLSLLMLFFLEILLLFSKVCLDWYEIYLFMEFYVSWGFAN